MFDMNKVTFKNGASEMQCGTEVGYQEIFYNGKELPNVILYTRVPWSPFKEVIEEIFIYPKNKEAGDYFHGEEVTEFGIRLLVKDGDYETPLKFYFKHKEEITGMKK